MNENDVKAVVAELLKPVTQRLDELALTMAAMQVQLPDNIQTAIAAALKAEEAAKSDNDASKWSKAARKWLTETGLVRGTGNGADGQPVYAWELPLTLERFGTILYRLVTTQGIPITPAAPEARGGHGPHDQSGGF